MKKDWEYIPLKNLCNNFRQDIVDGPFGSNLKREDYVTEGIPVLKIQNIKPFQIVLKKMDYVKPNKYNELKRHSYRSGDVILTKLGDPLGAAAIVEEIEDGLIVADLVRIRAQKINTRYLCYHLNSPNTNNYINSLQKGTTRPRVKIENVRDLPIYYPPLPEQQRIIDVLDEVFATISSTKENADKNLQNARELFESYLQSVFANPGDGWEEKVIGKCFKVRSGDFLPAREMKKDGIINVYGGNGIAGKHDKYNLSGENIIIGRVGAKCGNVRLVKDEIWLTDNALYICEFFKEFNLRFLEYLLNIKDLRNTANQTAQPVISYTTIKNIVLVIPPLPEQHSIVTKLDALSAETKRLEAIYQQKIANLEELKKSILQKAFNGEL